MSGYKNSVLRHNFSELAGAITIGLTVPTDTLAALRSLYFPGCLPVEYVARVLAPPAQVKDAWRVRTQVQLATHPYLRGAKSTVSRFVDLVALVDKSLNEPDDFDEFGGYGYLNAMANFGERH